MRHITRTTMLMIILLLMSLTVHAEKKRINLIFAHGGSSDHPYHIGALKFSELVKKASQGEIIIHIYPDGVMGSEGDAADGVRLSNVDIAVISAGGAMSHWIPEMQVLDMPYLFRDRYHAYSVLDGNIGSEFNYMMEKHGFKNLAYWEIGFRHITNNKKEITVPEDMKGLRIRVMPAKVYKVMMNELGATPIPIAFSNVYNAFQRGIIDGQENPMTTIRAMKYYEVQKYLSLTSHVYSSAVVIMNTSMFNGLSKVNQKILLDAAKEAGQFERKYVEIKEIEDIQFLKSHGMKMSQPDIGMFKAATYSIKDILAEEISPDMVERINATR